MDHKTSKSKLMIIITIIAIVGVIGVVAITSNKNANNNKQNQEQQEMTKEEMLAVAIDTTTHSDSSYGYFGELHFNKAKAESEKNKIFKISGVVSKVEKNYLLLSHYQRLY